MTTGDGIACLSLALVIVGTAWAAAWGTVRSMAIRAEALRRLGEGAWSFKTTTRTTTPKAKRSA